MASNQRVREASDLYVEVNTPLPLDGEVLYRVKGDGNAQVVRVNARFQVMVHTGQGSFAYPVYLVNLGFGGFFMRSEVHPQHRQIEEAMMNSPICALIDRPINDWLFETEG